MVRLTVSAARLSLAIVYLTTSVTCLAIRDRNTTSVQAESATPVSVLPSASTAALAHADSPRNITVAVGNTDAENHGNDITERGSSSTSSSSSGGKGSPNSSSSSSSSSSSNSGGKTGTGSTRGSTPAPKVSAGKPTITKVNGVSVASTSRGAYYYGGSRSPYYVTTSPYYVPSLWYPYYVPYGYWYGAGVWPTTSPFWVYGYPDTWPYYNATTGQTEQINVAVLCQWYSDCTAEYNNDSEFIRLAMGDGTWNGWNTGMVSVQQVNGTKTVLLNGSTGNNTDVLTSWALPRASMPSMSVIGAVAGCVMALQMLV